MSTNTENKNETGCGYLVLIIIAFIFWGLSSMINGNGFFQGIGEQIYAAFLLGVIALFIYIIYKIFLEK